MWLSKGERDDKGYTRVNEVDKQGRTSLRWGVLGHTRTKEVELWKMGCNVIISGYMWLNTVGQVE